VLPEAFQVTFDCLTYIFGCFDPRSALGNADRSPTPAQQFAKVRSLTRAVPQQNRDREEADAQILLTPTLSPDRHSAPQFVEEVQEHHDLMILLGRFRGFHRR
jgi:hypothetical protein